MDADGKLKAKEKIVHSHAEKEQKLAAFRKQAEFGARKFIKP